MNKPDNRGLDQAYSKSTSQYLGNYLSGSLTFRSKTKLKVTCTNPILNQWIVLEYTHFCSIQWWEPAQLKSGRVLTPPVLFSDLRWTLWRNTESQNLLLALSERKVQLCLVRYLKATQHPSNSLCKRDSYSSNPYGGDERQGASRQFEVPCKCLL